MELQDLFTIPEFIFRVQLTQHAHIAQWSSAFGFFNESGGQEEKHNSGGHDVSNVAISFE